MGVVNVFEIKLKAEPEHGWSPYVQGKRPALLADVPIERLQAERDANREARYRRK